LGILLGAVSLLIGILSLDVGYILGGAALCAVGSASWWLFVRVRGAVAK
jgi:hypothetical protein